jgi:hypothetical protein
MFLTQNAGFWTFNVIDKVIPREKLDDFDLLLAMYTIQDFDFLRYFNAT